MNLKTTDTPLYSYQEAHFNSFYLVAALVMIFMSMLVALQPLYLREILGLGRDNAGFINTNIQVITEIFDLLLIGYLGHLSDRFGRIPLVVFGFMVSGFVVLIIPFSKEIGLFVGINSLFIFYVARVTVSLGTTAVWPQLVTLTGDYTDQQKRPKLLANVGFMMAFGATLVYSVIMQLPKEIGVVGTILLTAFIAFAGAWLAKTFLPDTDVVNSQISKYKINKKVEKFPLRPIWELLKKEDGLKLSFLSSFTSRNDMVIIGLFLMMWFIYFSDLIADVTYVDAAARAGLIIGYTGLAFLTSTLVWGKLIIKLGRIPSIIMGLCLSGAGFISIGFIMNPFGVEILVPITLIGIGQAGCLLASQTLTLDLAPKSIRGSVMGIYNTIACIGIIFFLQIGGLLFDMVAPTAPFVFTGIANILVMMYGLFILKSKVKGNCAKVCC